jgi:hypothetical protein
MLEDMVSEFVQQDVQQDERGQAVVRPSDEGGAGPGLYRHDGSCPLECLGIAHGNRAKPEPGGSGQVIKGNPPGYAKAAEAQARLLRPGRAMTEFDRAQPVQCLWSEAAQESYDLAAANRIVEAGARRYLDYPRAGFRAAGPARGWQSYAVEALQCPAEPAPLA